ncbi:MAG: trypsin-like peptidase domain-containing protein [Eubacteriales bacterium]|nr:trypsin-like peptidase domain-containing protein [Eubacteriales bacterium]
MRNNESKKSFLGYIAITLALAVVITGTTALIKMNPTADAEAVTVSENATVVSSPFTEAVQKVRGSVVGVNNYTTYSSRNSYYGYGYGYGFGNGSGSSNGDDSSRQVLQGSGSGVVIAKGYVLTNYHVVEDATMLEVTMGDQTYSATVAGTDETLDLAVLKVDNLDIEPVVLGDSDVLNVGDWAICIGNPLSFTGTTTVGVISALNREISNNTTDAYGLRTNDVNLMIQTDAAINAGNSGGGMFNVAGELVGVPSMKYTGSYYSSSTVEGIGMAIPINVAKPLIEQVVSGQTVSGSADSTESSGSTNNAAIAAVKPRIGVTVTNINSSSAVVANGYLPNGVYVKEVESGSPAEKAGLKVGDIIVDVDGTVISSSNQMISILQAKNVGDTATLKIYRANVNLEEPIEDYTTITGDYIDLTVELAMLDTAQP